MVQKEGAVGGDGEDGGSSPSGLAEHRRGVGRVEGGVDFVDVEEGASGIAAPFFPEGRQAVNDAMRRQDEQSGAVHVDESHHGEFVRSFAGTWSGLSVDKGPDNGLFYGD